PEQKRLPCRFAARKSLAISGKSVKGVVLAGEAVPPPSGRKPATNQNFPATAQPLIEHKGDL
ncbi:MAG: hypothetical protein IKF98_04200, partial [Clostridia bacterium]|nr:hypothetical protein [Clostridia bacterium]